MLIITSYNILRAYCPKCKYYFLVDSNCIDDYYKCSKCGFELNETIKKNVEDYKLFVKTLHRIAELISKRILNDKTYVDIGTEVSKLLDLYNKKVIV